MYYRIYKDTAGYWRWTFYAANHRKIADSGEGYANKQDCRAGLDMIANSRGAPVHEQS